MLRLLIVRIWLAEDCKVTQLIKYQVFGFSMLWASNSSTSTCVQSNRLKPLKELFNGQSGYRPSYLKLLSTWFKTVYMNKNYAADRMFWILNQKACLNLFLLFRSNRLLIWSFGLMLGLKYFEPFSLPFCDFLQNRLHWEDILKILVLRTSIDFDERVYMYLTSWS